MRGFSDTMKFNKAIWASVFAVPALLFTSAAKGAPVTGMSNIAGNVTVTGSAIAFSPTFTSTTGAMQTGSFSGLTGGTIQSLTGGPVTGDTMIPGFISINKSFGAPVTFELT